MVLTWSSLVLTWSLILREEVVGASPTASSTPGCCVVPWLIRPPVVVSSPGLTLVAKPHCPGPNESHPSHLNLLVHPPCFASSLSELHEESAAPPRCACSLSWCHGKDVRESTVPSLCPPAAAVLRHSPSPPSRPARQNIRSVAASLQGDRSACPLRRCNGEGAACAFPLLKRRRHEREVTDNTLLSRRTQRRCDGEDLIYVSIVPRPATVAGVSNSHSELD